MKLEQIKCDHCGNIHGLAETPSVTVFAVLNPQQEAKLDFCGFDCIREFLVKVQSEHKEVVDTSIFIRDRQERSVL